MPSISISGIDLSGSSVHISNSNGGYFYISSCSYTSISTSNGVSIQISTSSHVTNGNLAISGGTVHTNASPKKKKKKSSKTPKQPKQAKPPKITSARVPKALPPAPPRSVASSTRRDIEPEDGYCWLLLFKSKYWNQLRSMYGPNTVHQVNAPHGVLREFMRQYPHMVSSRRDLIRQQTAPNLSHISPHGNSSPWEIMGW